MPKGKFVLINGVNYTIYIIAAAGLVLFGGLQYTICRRPTKKSHRQAMLFVPFLILCAALFVFGAEGGGSFLDVRGAVALALMGYGFLSLAAISAGWLAAAVKNDKEAKASCPFNEK